MTQNAPTKSIFATISSPLTLTSTTMSSSTAIHNALIGKYNLLVSENERLLIERDQFAKIVNDISKKHSDTFEYLQGELYKLAHAASEKPGLTFKKEPIPAPAASSSTSISPIPSISRLTAPIPHSLSPSSSSSSSSSSQLRSGLSMSSKPAVPVAKPIAKPLTTPTPPSSHTSTSSSSTSSSTPTPAASAFTNALTMFGTRITARNSMDLRVQQLTCKSHNLI